LLFLPNTETKKESDKSLLYGLGDSTKILAKKFHNNHILFS